MRNFQLIPAIDLLGGRCVRLAQGRYDEVTRYGDPAAAAARFAAAPGLQRLHIVDLDGARSGAPAPENRAAAQSILAALQSRGIAAQLGGGLRSLASVEAWLSLGVERAILGTAALRNPKLVREAARLYPGRIGVGVDARNGRVAVQGWLEAGDCSALDLARRFEDAGVAAIIHTDIARDGMGSGPNLEASAALAAALSIPVIASGGVGSLAHVRAAAQRPGIAGLIVGRALHDGAIQLDDALKESDAALKAANAPEAAPCC